MKHPETHFHLFIFDHRPHFPFNHVTLLKLSIGRRSYVESLFWIAQAVAEKTNLKLKRWKSEGEKEKKRGSRPTIPHHGQQWLWMPITSYSCSHWSPTALSLTALNSSSTLHLQTEHEKWIVLGLLYQAVLGKLEALSSRSLQHSFWKNYNGRDFYGQITF